MSEYIEDEEYVCINSHIPVNAECTVKKGTSVAVKKIFNGLLAESTLGWEYYYSHDDFAKYYSMPIQKRLERYIEKQNIDLKRKGVSTLKDDLMVQRLLGELNILNDLVSILKHPEKLVPIEQ